MAWSLADKESFCFMRQSKKMLCTQIWGPRLDGGTSPGSIDVNSALMTCDFPGSPSVPELMVVNQGPQIRVWKMQG